MVKLNLALKVLLQELLFGYLGGGHDLPDEETSDNDISEQSSCDVEEVESDDSDSGKEGSKQTLTLVKRTDENGFFETTALEVQPPPFESSPKQSPKQEVDAKKVKINTHKKKTKAHDYASTKKAPGLKEVKEVQTIWQKSRVVLVQHIHIYYSSRTRTTSITSIDNRSLFWSFFTTSIYMYLTVKVINYTEG